MESRIRTVPKIISGSVEAYVRADTMIEWLKANPVLLNLEMGYEIDTNRFKVGNGTDNWMQLPYYMEEGTFLESKSI